MRGLVIAALTGLLALACWSPAAADEGYVDLSVRVELDRQAYLPTEQVKMTVTVRNNGTAPATGVVLRSTGDMTFAPWGDLDESGPGVTLEPDGGYRRLSVFATPNDPGEGMTQQVTALSAEPDQNQEDNTRSVSAFVTAEHADLTLRLHADTDDDHVVDPGETMAGVQFTLHGGVSAGEVTGRTDAQGVIRFAGITGGRYSVGAKLPYGWYLEFPATIEVRAGANDIVMRAWHVDITKLVASVTLDRSSYTVGDTVRERVTLTNNDDVDMTGVIAMCNRYTVDMTPQNDLTSENWGELSPAGPGATIRAGETRTWEFTDVVTDKMWEYGFAVARCQFIVPPMTSGAYAEASAAVPGGRGTLGGRLTYERAPVPDVTVLLLDHGGTIVARATSDASGHFAFPELPANEYELRATGPWRLTQNTFWVQVLARRHYEFPILELRPSPTYTDPEARERTEEVPVPQAAPAPHPDRLAETGADVAELLAFGVLLVVVGLVLVRRRTGNCV